jgi:ribonuclease HI
MTHRHQHPVTVVTDGACSGNGTDDARGGWAAIIIAADGSEVVLTGAEAPSTNNRMELMAAIRALEALTKPCTVELHTDSKYVQQGIKEWLHLWKARGWKTYSKGAVKNEDLWKRLDQARLKHEVDWRWIKGHAGHEWNERADVLAGEGLREALGER